MNASRLTVNQSINQLIFICYEQLTDKVSSRQECRPTLVSNATESSETTATVRQTVQYCEVWTHQLSKTQTSTVNECNSTVITLLTCTAPVYRLTTHAAADAAADDDDDELCQWHQLMTDSLVHTWSCQLTACWPDIAAAAVVSALAIVHSC